MSPRGTFEDRFIFHMQEEAYIAIINVHEIEAEAEKDWREGPSISGDMLETEKLHIKER